MNASGIVVFLGLVAFSAAGYLAHTPLAYNYHHAPALAYSSPLAYHHAPALPLAYTTHTYNTLAHNYQLKLDTTLPGKAYAGTFPFGAAPTAYGYGVLKK